MNQVNAADLATSLTTDDILIEYVSPTSSSRRTCPAPSSCR